MVASTIGGGDPQFTQLITGLHGRLPYCNYTSLIIKEDEEILRTGDHRSEA